MMERGSFTRHMSGARLSMSHDQEGNSAGHMDEARLRMTHMGETSDV